MSNQRGASAGTRAVGGSAGTITNANTGKLAIARSAQSPLAQLSISSQGVLGGASSSQQSPSPWSQGMLEPEAVAATVASRPASMGSTAATDCTSKSIANKAMLKDGQRR